MQHTNAIHLEEEEYILTMFVQKSMVMLLCFHCSDVSSFNLICLKVLINYIYKTVDAKPIPCPFQGPFKFTYNRGQGECSYPQSTIDTCTDDSHLQFRFQACHDVPGTESRGNFFLYNKYLFIK